MARNNDVNRERPPEGDYDKPMPQQKPLPFLPDREWLKGRISKVEYEYVYFGGQLQYVTDKDQQPIIDEVTGEQIPRRQFQIEVMLNDHSLPNGDPRRVWIRLGASLGPKAHLPQFLSNLKCPKVDPTPKEVIEYLQEKDIKLQVANKVSQESGKEYQQVVWDSVKLAK